jgi:hypothetical protein
MRALSMDELDWVSGGWGFDGDPPRETETVVVTARRRPYDYWYENGRVEDFFANQAQYRDMVCGAIAAEIRSEERDVIAGGAIITVGVAAGGGALVATGTIIGAPAGFVLGVTGGAGVLIGGIVVLSSTAQANALDRRQAQFNCPSR